MLCMNNLQDRMMKELYEQGKTIQDIVEVLKRTPIHPRIAPAITAAHDLGYIHKPFLDNICLHNNINIFLHSTN